MARNTGIPAPKGHLYTPQNALSALLGVNTTATEQKTMFNELSGGQNIFTDVTGAAYVRPGSSILGGIAGTTPIQGGFVFRDNNQRIAIFAVIGGKFFTYDGTTLSPLASSPTLNATLLVNGCFFPDVNKFYVTNGTDSVVEMDQSSGSLTATSRSAMPKSLFLGYNDHHLYFLNLPANPSQYYISDLGAITYNTASIVNTQGYILGMANLDSYNAILVTDQMAYRMTGTFTSYDGSNNLVYAPGSFLPIGRSRCIAPRSIMYLNNYVYWVGLDDFNNAEIYSCDSQNIRPIGWTKLKAYLRTINTTALSSACATQYGYYAKFAVPVNGSGYNNAELLLDTARSVSYTESGNFGPPQIIWEPIHYPGYTISQYGTWKSSGQDYVLAFDQVIGCAHRTNVGTSDELPLVTTFPAPGSSPTLSSVSVTPTVFLDQQFSPTSPVTVVELALTVSAFSAGSGTVTFALQTDTSGNPSGTTLASATINVTSTPPPVLSFVLSTAYPLSINTPYHIVISTTGGNLTVTTQTPAVLGTNYQTGSGSTWSAGSGNPLFILTYQAPIDASLLWTTFLEVINAKKRTNRALINGTSKLGAAMTLGISSQGRDGQFTTSAFNLQGSTAVWGTPTNPQPANVLTWAFPGAAATPTNSWSGSSANFSLTVFPPYYQIPSQFVSYQLRSVGTTDWRINSFVPIVSLIPSTILP